MAITESERTEFIGAHLRPEVKDAIYTIALIRNISVSKLISDMIEYYLVRYGQEAEGLTVETDVDFYSVGGTR
jgi:hypothetical protein